MKNRGIEPRVAKVKGSEQNPNTEAEEEMLKKVDVAAALELLVHSGRAWTMVEVEPRLAPDPVQVPVVAAGTVELGVYDQWVRGVCP